MSIISFNGIDYGCSGSPKIEQITEANYQALVQAGEVDPSIAYFRMDAPNLYPPIQDDGSATDLTNGALATGQTIKSVLKKPVVVSSSTIAISSGHNAVFRLWSNGMKSFECQDGSMPVAAVTTGAIIPDIYVPISGHIRGFGWDSQYNSSSTTQNRGRAYTIGTDKKIYLYLGTATGFYATIFYI